MTSAVVLQATATAALPAPSASVADLSAAARKGDLAARVEMGRRLALGQGVSKDEADAVSYFRGIVSEFQDIGAHDKRGPNVAAAFLEMARLYKNGAPKANIEANPAQAFSFFHHAASYFGDPAAQVELAKLLLSGDGVTKNTRVAAQWLLSASKKGYAPAQALLGNLLWRGGDGVKRVAGDGRTPRGDPGQHRRDDPELPGQPDHRPVFDAHRRLHIHGPPGFAGSRRRSPQRA